MVAAVRATGGPQGGRPSATRPSGAVGRVAAAQREARRSLALAASFAAAAVVAAAVPHDTGSWLPMHLLLAGAMTLAVSGAALASVGRDRVEHRFDGAYRSYFATQARAARPPRSSVAAQDTATAVMCTGVVLAAGGALSAQRLIGAAGFVVYAAGICLVVRQLRLPGWEKARWAGPRLVQTYVAVCWWIGSVLAAAVRSVDGEPPLSGGVLIALGVGGYAQLLVASLAYLGPVLRGGGHERLAAGFATTRSWVGLAAVNLGVVLLLAGRTLPAAGAIGAWALDACWRGLRLVRR